LNQVYDVEAVRRDFPILSRTVHDKPLVYLDNGASAQKPQAVIDAVSHAYANEYANVHRGLHFLSNAATDAYENAREIVGGSSTHPPSTMWCSPSRPPRRSIPSPMAMAMPIIGEGDEIVITIMEHHSNIVPWHFLRERQGAKIVWVGVDDHGNFDLDDFRKALTDRTKLVAIAHMSNVLGTVVDVKEVCRIAHERGVKVLIDGSQAAVHMPVDVQDIDCDWYVMTGHKLYGPVGHRRALRQDGRAQRHAAFYGRRRDDRRCERRRASPTMIRRTGLRPVPRRSSRRSVWARARVHGKARSRPDRGT
jgi:cysteine desulfurase/selenocysteine lyase